MYSSRALEARRCTGLKSNGQPCRAFACWGDIRQRCPRHGGRRQIGGDRPPNCNCEAYDWPHRPAGGLCRWPDPPGQRSSTKQGTRSAVGKQRKRHKKLARRFGIDPNDLGRDPTLAPLLEIYAIFNRIGGS